MDSPECTLDIETTRGRLDYSIDDGHAGLLLGGNRISRTSTHHKEKGKGKQLNSADKALCVRTNVNLLICEISGFSDVCVNHEICVMQQLFPGLNPILSGTALQSIHLMNNGKFNPWIVRSTCLWYSSEERDKLLVCFVAERTAMTILHQHIPDRNLELTIIFVSGF